VQARTLITLTPMVIQSVLLVTQKQGVRVVTAHQITPPMQQQSVAVQTAAPVPDVVTQKQLVRAVTALARIQLRIIRLVRMVVASIVTRKQA